LPDRLRRGHDRLSGLRAAGSDGQRSRGELAAAGVIDPPDVIVADAGYWHLEQMNTITGDGIAVLVPPDSSRRKNRPGGRDGTAAPTTSCATCSTPSRRALYKQRAQLIEPIFGHTKHNRGSPALPGTADPPHGPSGGWWPPPHNLLKLNQHFTAT
jgi:hypothetical protein